MIEKVDATKVRFGRDEALALARTAKKVVAGRGPNAIELDPKKTDDAALIVYLLGPTGNLKAPTLRIGATLVVGYNESTYEKLFG